MAAHLYKCWQCSARRTSKPLIAIVAALARSKLTAATSHTAKTAIRATICPGRAAAALAPLPALVSSRHARTDEANKIAVISSTRCEHRLVAGRSARLGQPCVRDRRCANRALIGANSGALRSGSSSMAVSMAASSATLARSSADGPSFGDASSARQLTEHNRPNISD